jgi:acetyl esterase/lipase
MFKSSLITAILLMTVLITRGQEVIPIYPGPIPGAKPTPEKYVEQSMRRANGTFGIIKVSVPTLTIYEAPKDIANGTAVIVCPGGGYSFLAFEHEGVEIAKRFNAIGVTAFVLKYRLPSDEIMEDKKFALLQDAQQAIYTIRKNASKYKVKANKIGIIGFSAGGHFASTLTTHYDDLKISNPEKINLRPDFSVLVYPVISFEEFTHAGTKKGLLGTEPSPEMIKYFSANKNISKKTPPVYLVHAKDDKVVPIENTYMLTEALKQNKVNTDQYIYELGGHGFGLKNTTSDVDWFNLMADWLKEIKILK